MYFLQQCLNAIQISAFYGLLAVAYVLIYGIANRINLAFGATAAWAGHLAIAGVTILAATSPLGVTLTVALTLILAVAGTCALGFAIQRIVFWPLIGKSTLAILIATIGLAIVIEETLRIANNGHEQWLAPMLSDPILLVESAEFSVQTTYLRGLVLMLSVTLSFGLIFFIGKHPFGRIWRACSQDSGMAALCGISVGAALATTFLISSAYAAASGAIVALYYGNVSFYMGLSLGFKTLLAAVIGGLHSVGGAFLGAAILGLLESFWSAYFDGTYRDVAVFGILTLLMVLRPNGLLTRSVRVDQPFSVPRDGPGRGG